LARRSGGRHARLRRRGEGVEVSGWADLRKKKEKEFLLLQIKELRGNFKRNLGEIQMGFEMEFKGG
jgi:hypothetical protein